jgi:hypothetical protein
MTDFRALCEELANRMDSETGYTRPDGTRFSHPAVVRARAALAEQPVGATDEELWAVGDEDFRANYYPTDAIRYARAVLARWGQSAATPIPVDERLPGAAEQALIKAECALSDIAEGEAEESEGDPLEWAEKRAAGALARIRPVMREYQICTSEWPPLPAHAIPLPQSEP